jgi:CBS domain containing-hemolysin-like protein
MKKITLRGSLPFILAISAISFPIGAAFDTTTIFLDSVPWYVGGTMVVLIVAIGAMFDMLGVSAAAASEVPFHSMAAKRVFGAKRAVMFVRHAEKVSSICSDVIGDIAAVLSGAGTLAVAVQLGESFGAKGWQEELTVILLTAFTTSLTILAKAAGKTLAISSHTRILLTAAQILDLVTFRGRPHVRDKKSGK